MPYSNTVNLLSIEGGTWPQVTARLWMLWSVVGTGTGTGRQQMEQGSDTVQSAGTFTFSFPLGPDFLSVSRSVGVSLQDAGRVASDDGWWFRSGSFDTLPTGPIEVVLAGAVTRTPADLTAALPPLPMTVSAATTITGPLTVTPQDNGLILLTAVGTTTEPPLPAPVGFTYSLEFNLMASRDVAAGEQEVFEIGSPGLGTITFTSTGGPVSTIEAVVLNAVSDFILREVTPMFKRRLETSLNAAILSSIAGLLAPGTTTMPAGVVVSVRTVATRSTGVTVRAALAAFDGVFSKFPPSPPQPSNGGPCPLKTLQALMLPGLQLSLFRELRDTSLAASATGQRLTRLYYGHGREVSRLLLMRPRLAGRAALLLPPVQEHLAAGGPIPRSLARRCEELLADIGACGSAELRSDIAFALATDPWSTLGRSG
jgi:hypothetical protein